MTNSRVLMCASSISAALLFFVGGCAELNSPGGAAQLEVAIPKPANLSQLDKLSPSLITPAENGPDVSVINIGPGTKIAKLGSFFQVNPDCSTAGLAEIVGAANTKNGTLSVLHTIDYPNFTDDNKYSKCNLKAIDGMTVFYTRKSGFIGNDNVIINIFYPNGSLETFQWNIKSY